MIVLINQLERRLFQHHGFEGVSIEIRTDFGHQIAQPHGFRQLLCFGVVLRQFEELGGRTRLMEADVRIIGDDRQEVHLGNLGQNHGVSLNNDGFGTTDAFDRSFSPNFYLLATQPVTSHVRGCQESKRNHRFYGDHQDAGEVPQVLVDMELVVSNDDSLEEDINHPRYEGHETKTHVEDLSVEVNILIIVDFGD